MEYVSLSLVPTPETLQIIERLGGVWRGGHAMVRCPAHGDRTPSLSIRQGRASVLVHCFAGCTGTEVMRAIRHVLGRPIVNQCPSISLDTQRPAPFRRIWAEAIPIEGTLAQRYLRDLRGITFIPPDVRFHARCPLGKGRAVRFLPALLVGVFRHGHLIAIQRLFLDSSTAARTARMMLGNSRGGIWPARFTGNIMRVAEGFETACAYRQITGLNASTCFGTRNFAGIELPSAGSTVVLLPDNDIEGQAMAEYAIRRHQDKGVLATIITCPAGFGDWADILPKPGLAA